MNKMKIILRRSKGPKKFEVEFENGKVVRFGLKGYSDFTLHKNPLRMRSYVKRHGGAVSGTIRKMTDPKKVLRAMRNVSKSDKEYWTLSGIKSPGFWSRWLLWSEPTLDGAIKLIENKFNVKIMKR